MHVPWSVHTNSNSHCRRLFKQEAIRDNRLARSLSKGPIYMAVAGTKASPALWSMDSSSDTSPLVMRWK